MRWWLAVLGMGVLSVAWARPRKDEAEAETRAAAERGPAASASEIPALAALLAKAGWTPTPELSGVFKAGSIFEVTGMGHTLVSSSCISIPPEESTYTAAELVTSLQAGVSVGGPLANGGAYAGIVKKVKFGTPTQMTVPTMDLELSQVCQEKLKKLPASRIQNAYIVQEVLKAEISEQTCGKVDARGSFVGLGSAEAEYAAACSQASLEPVAVGYRTVPLSSLLVLNTAETASAEGGGTSGRSSVSSGGFDSSGTLAQIQAAKDLEKRLSDELDRCLTKQEKALTAQAAKDATSLSPLLKETSAKAKELGGPQVKRYVALYGSATVKCTNDLGERSRTVSVPAVALMRAWLDTSVTGAGVSGGTWTGASGYTMMAVPAGTYELGCTASQSGCSDDEKPAHLVKLSRGTLMGKTEVTQGLYKDVMGTNPSYFSNCGPACPVEGQTWVGAAKFANALSTRDGLEPCYVISGDRVTWPRGLGCTGYRLPTEAEWEVAARGGEDEPFAGSSNIDAVGWYFENTGDGGEYPVDVGRKAANDFGLQDMTGNAYEWVWDLYGPYREELVVDPLGATTGADRVLRGGGFDMDAADCRVSKRISFDPVGRADGSALGFRLARTLP